MSDTKGQLGNALLVILTVALVVCASINYQQQKVYNLPDDGVTWVDAPVGNGETEVRAVHIQPGSAGDRAGLRTGDVVHAIGSPVTKAQQVAQLLFRVGAFSNVTYTLARGGQGFDAKLILDEAPRDRALYAQYAVGLAYLAIGVFLFFRRSRAPQSLHFYLLCLVSFVLYTFHYTGKLNNFDTAIYVGNVMAGLLAPAMFVHFCLSFAEEKRSPWILAAVYTPAAALIVLQLALATGLASSAVPLLEIRWVLDRGWLFLFSACYLVGALILHAKYVQADDAIMRQQLKWLRNGTLLGIIPFTVLYVAPFVMGQVPGNMARLGVLFLAFIPLTWAYAILRYRLMDVDIIFQQGYVYMLATIGVMGVVYALVYALAKRDELSPSAVVLLVLVAVFIFQPLRNWIQEQLDRYLFYKDQYDYRRTLIDFARELSSEMDLDHTLKSVGDRLMRTLSLGHVGFFLENEEPNAPGFHIASMLTREGSRSAPADVDLSFLQAHPDRPYLFFERTRHVFDVLSRDWTPSVRATIARLDLTYYLPCIFRGRTVAWLGVSRTAKGDFLASDDVELLVTLSNYVAMAVENARLYRSLADKAAQYERLKEFSENIVESINVGILAADLDDRVESWNSQIEKLTGVSRANAVGRRLGEIFPEDLAQQFALFPSGNRVHQLYRVPMRPLADGANVQQDRTVNIAIAPLVTKEGDQIGRLVIFDDVTEREDLQRRLVQADKLSSIGLLAAGVAHEVNTPLAVISSYAQMLAKQMNGDDTRTRLLDKIAKQTFRASEIVNSLLNFSRTSQSVEYDEVNLNKVVREVASLLEHQIQKAGVELHLDLDEDLPMIRGNFGRLQQVFLNLFLNARDAMERGGAITVTSRAAGELVRLEVTDTGTGIQPEVLDRIFDPFFTTKMAKKGTGLGLSVTYGIVEEHGGRIEAMSAPGEGATFRLDFPAVRKTVNA